MSVLYLWQVRILRLAWLQYAAAWAGIPVLYSAEAPAYTVVPQVRRPCPARRPIATRQEIKMTCADTSSALHPIFRR